MASCSKADTRKILNMEGPAWFQAMKNGDLVTLREELRKLPDIDNEWYALSASKWSAYNPLGYAIFYLGASLDTLQCVLDAGANPDKPCVFCNSLPVLDYMERYPLERGGYNLEIAQLLVKYGAHTYGTCARAFVLRQRASDYAIVWCFASVLPPGARDIAEEFLKRYDELSWTHMTKK